MSAARSLLDVEAPAAANNSKGAAGDGTSLSEPGAGRVAAAASGGTAERPSLGKAILLASAGNVVEWFDFTIFGLLAKQIGAAFFPPAKEEAQLIETFSVFGAAFLARPLGGIIFGWIGDRRSKQFALQLSLFLMAISTTLMGCLPTYAHIGRAAPILLVLLRMLQGVAVGGQLVGTWVFVHTHAPPGTGGLYGGLVLSGVACGVLLGAVVGTVLHETFPPAALQRYGFRIPFLCGFLVALAGLALHKYVPEVEEIEAATGPGTAPPTPREQQQQQQQQQRDPRAGVGYGDGDGEGATVPSGPGAAVVPKPNPLKALVAGHKLELLVGTPALILYCTAFYECLVWLPTYLTTLVPHHPVAGAFPITTSNLALAILLFPLAGRLADRYGYYRVMLAGGLWLLVTAPLAFHILRRGTPAAAFCGQLLFVLGLTLHSGPFGLFLTEHMTTCPHLYTAVAVSYNTAMAIFGGLASVVCTGLHDKLHGYGAAAWLLAVAFVACAALHVGYHPTRGVVLASRRRGAMVVVDGRKLDEEVAVAVAGGRGEGKEGQLVVPSIE